MRSRPILERLATLVLTSWLLIATSVGGLHDPRCPHHPGGSGDQPVSAGHEGHAPAPRGHEGHQEHQAPSGDAEDACSCEGGLCVLSAAVDVCLQSACGVPLDAPRFETSSAPAIADLRPDAHSYSQPPGRGPPAVV